jgi:signal transduction histidine kinase
MQQAENVVFIVLFTIIMLVLIAGIVLFIVQYRKRKIEHITEKTMITQKHNEELLATQLEIQLQTMQHIGREIHDSVGQKLTLASLYTQQLAYENKAPNVTEKIETISGIINQSLQELRHLSKSLTDDNINENNIAALIAAECEKINALKKCTASYMAPAKPPQMNYQAKSIVLRVVQEFMQNSIKHADCKNISIKLETVNDAIEFTLTDDGKGFDTQQKNFSGIGLANMQKRITMLGGTCNLQSTSAGTTLQIRILA